ncbi:phenylalanine--tRNA ligase subunit alpha [Sodalis endosymbiont of Henestaris halophilus]|uniref:phenylalanine--tRNA ligase subunit alpha n=1 Tax=Sodalis endosymbiont of Henestaris halophilus TaxID=1929246 RepID=UPI000BC0EE59|nr:phenylalanine--tRNA ligase subunit alpha [Sodalis endosymbiont of Henestaris halophilus]SNC58813.1 Phenylalanine--tRNA ligase alpha subunit [Sodalis endosymbiont of Henestaris halophilus]
MSHLAELIIQAKIAIAQCQDIQALESVRVKYLGKKGYFTKQMLALRDLAPDVRPAKGAVINQAKRDLQKLLAEREIKLKRADIETRLAEEMLDVSLPGRRMGNGGLHPVSRTIERIEHFFCNIGFSVITGPEIEDEYHNFDALNIPVHHPARDAHDTFWFDATRLLRTHTSGVQIRAMKKQRPPIRILSTGRVYRHDYDKFHTPMFHQMEGLIIDIDINFANLKSTLHDFLCNFFEEDLQVRFRPSYFPFTEPSAEIDVMGKNGHWLEVLGCGMVHPNVLRNGKINPEIYSGFAFGMGMERLTMQRYDITDLRAFFENDLRFLKQFK